ncbi:MAG: hypothetical protein ACLU6P_05235 [Roseburia intestinalis]
MKKLKKRFIVPAVVFILGMCALIGAIYVVGESQKQQNRTNAKLNAQWPVGMPAEAAAAGRRAKI